MILLVDKARQLGKPSFELLGEQPIKVFSKPILII
jgi:hypothetical protein